MKTAVVSQPMYFPWLGMFEQIKIADILVHYDDVQMPLGRSFISRVQLKTARGITWLTVPIRRRSGQSINEVEIDDTQPWRRRHLALLDSSFRDAPYRAEAIGIAEAVLDAGDRWLNRLNIRGIEAVCGYLDLDRRFALASEMAAHGRGTDRLIALLAKLDATRYVTGHGAVDYLDHPALEARGIEVSYMEYARLPYRQSHGAFTPYVTALDAIAHLGKSARKQLVSGTRSWRDFVASRRTSTGAAR